MHSMKNIDVLQSIFVSGEISEFRQLNETAAYQGLSNSTSQHLLSYFLTLSLSICILYLTHTILQLDQDEVQMPWAHESSTIIMVH